MPDVTSHAMRDRAGRPARRGTLGWQRDGTPGDRRHPPPDARRPGTSPRRWSGRPSGCGPWCSRTATTSLAGPGPALRRGRRRPGGGRRCSWPSGNDEWEATVVAQPASGRHRLVVRPGPTATPPGPTRCGPSSRPARTIDVEIAEGWRLRRSRAGPPPATPPWPAALTRPARTPASTAAARVGAGPGARPSPRPCAGPAGAADVTARRPQPLWVDRERALFGAWYELFPRSFGGFKGAAARVPEVAAMGFDVLYLPPIHPIGVTARKGPQQHARRRPRRPGQPLGHRQPRGRAHRHPPGPRAPSRTSPSWSARSRAHGMEVALDYALQCSPDHPWVRRAPRVVPPPAGRLHRLRREPAEEVPGHLSRSTSGPTAEADRVALWEACKEILEYWIAQGVTDLPGRQPPHQADRLLGVADPGGAGRASRGAVPGRGVHPPQGHGPPGRGRIQPELHLFHLADRAARPRGAVGLHGGAGPRPGGRLHAAQLLAQHPRHPVGPVAQRAAGRLRPAAGAGRHPEPVLRRSTAATSCTRTCPASATNEEYLDSEKYEIKDRDLRPAGHAWPR